MQEVILYLIQNPEVAEKLQAGLVEMIGLTVEENGVLREVFGSSVSKVHNIKAYWG